MHTKDEEAILKLILLADSLHVFLSPMFLLISLRYLSSNYTPGGVDNPAISGRT